MAERLTPREMIRANTRQKGLITRAACLLGPAQPGAAQHGAPRLGMSGAGPHASSEAWLFRGPHSLRLCVMSYVGYTKNRPLLHGGIGEAVRAREPAPVGPIPGKWVPSGHSPDSPPTLARYLHNCLLGRPPLGPTRSAYDPRSSQCTHLVEPHSVASRPTKTTKSDLLRGSRNFHALRHELSGFEEGFVFVARMRRTAAGRGRGSLHTEARNHSAVTALPRQAGLRPDASEPPSPILHQTNVTHGTRHRVP